MNSRPEQPACQQARSTEVEATVRRAYGVAVLVIIALTYGDTGLAPGNLMLRSHTQAFFALASMRILCVTA
jgi:hypothetical protein